MPATNHSPPSTRSGNQRPTLDEQWKRSYVGSCGWAAGSAGNTRLWQRHSHYEVFAIPCLRSVKITGSHRASHPWHARSGVGDGLRRRGLLLCRRGTSFLGGFARSSGAVPVAASRRRRAAPPGRGGGRPVGFDTLRAVLGWVVVCGIGWAEAAQAQAVADHEQ